MFVTSLPHMRPTGTMCSHQFGDVEAAFSYWNVPNTHPVVVFARLSFTATSSCKSRSVGRAPVPDERLISPCHSRLPSRKGTCVRGAVLKSNLQPTTFEGNFAFRGSGCA